MQEIYIYTYLSIYLSIHLSIYLSPCACTWNAQYCDFHARQRQHVEWWIGYLFSAFSSATALQATPAAHSFWELHCASADKSTPNPNEAYAFVACNNGGNDWFEIRIRRSNVKAAKSMISWDPDGRNESRVKTTNHNHYIQNSTRLTTSIVHSPTPQLS